jgi:hypothetical protein
VNTKELQAVVSGALIIIFIMQDEDNRSKGSVIRLKSALLNKLKSVDRSFSKLADDAFKQVLDKYVNDCLQLDVGILIEAIALNKQDAMREFYGNNIIDLVCRAAYKITVSGLTQKQGKDSYMIADELKEALEKVIFEYKKEIGK